MAHEKLSPRQKMIGMMYLVLTAMLALNVSKDVVKAFMKVDKGLNQTVNNYVLKNASIYSEFELSFASYPEKTGPFRTKALAVKQRADEMYNFIQDLKILIIKTADGDDAPAINGRDIDIEKVVRYDDNNVPSQILIGSKEDGKAYSLKATLDSYRKFLIDEVISGGAPAIDESLKKTLNTDDSKNEDGDIEKWPNLTFQLLPLVGANALLTKMQVDVRNSETEVLNYLFSQIDKTNFKFNKISPIVIPKSTYVTVGQNYEASVFLAASDSTQPAKITVDGQLLPLDELNRGIYTARASSTGIRKWGGVIALTGPTGTVNNIEFSSEYSVGEPNATVSASAVNILYRGIDNPLDITIPSIRPDRISASSNGGAVSRKKVMNARTKEYFPGDWAINPTAEPGSTIQITVSGKDESGRTASYPPVKYRIRNIPNPIAEFGGKSSGTISKGTAMNMNEVFAVLRDFEFDLQFKVLSFSMSFPGNFGTFDKISNSSKLTTEQMAEVKKMTRGQKLIFESIIVQKPGGTKEQASSIILTID
ncbi:MAG: gliding motility protein GldM [Bacteroidia bacterium]|nr:gliding motility protein GldM [Bacteroidia bacterium]